MKPSSFLYAALANVALAAPSGIDLVPWATDPNLNDKTILVGSYTKSIYTLRLSTNGSNPHLWLQSNNPTGSAVPSWLSRGPSDRTILTCDEDNNAMQTFDFDARTGKLETRSR
ncbi:MAG: hypothetical protein M1816_007431 [Peltula sp. TS41687]|nr:MAG: hypothetical protein M1816_007431 [Peltula sp. TS41687]